MRGLTRGVRYGLWGSLVLTAQVQPVRVLNVLHATCGDISSAREPLASERLRCLRMTRLLGLAEGGGEDRPHWSPDSATQTFWDAKRFPWGKFGALHLGGRRNVLRGFRGVKGISRMGIFKPQAAKECSPGRKPWVKSGNRQAPAGAKEASPKCISGRIQCRSS